MKYTESKKIKINVVGSIDDKSLLERNRRVYGVGGLCATITSGQSDHIPYILIEKETKCIEYEN